MNDTKTPELVLCELERPALPGLESFSPFCLKVHRGLRAAGLPYRSRHADRPAAHRALNATGQVPVLLLDGRPIPDSTAILRALLELAPGRIAASPEDWLFEELADTALNGFLVAARWADEANWPLTRAAYFQAMPPPVRAIVPALIRRRVVRQLEARDIWRAGAAACWERFERLLAQLEARAPLLGFWSGPELSVADLALFGQLHSFRTPLTARQADSIVRKERLSGWLDRVDRATRRSVTSAEPMRAIA
jgi:glutathione S-transferase